MIGSINHQVYRWKCLRKLLIKQLLSDITQITAVNYSHFQSAIVNVTILKQCKIYRHFKAKPRIYNGLLFLQKIDSLMSDSSKRKKKHFTRISYRLMTVDTGVLKPKAGAFPWNAMGKRLDR